MKVLVTGGAGYIGSHTILELKRAGMEVVVYDSLKTGFQGAVQGGTPLIIGDIRDKDLLCAALREHRIDAVIHFAASSLVGESMTEPSKYYNNNVVGTLTLLDAMRECGVGKIVFSSTAAVYGEPDKWPITEDMPTAPTNVYGRTKLAIEQMLADFAMAYGMKYICLRYFNAAGAADKGDLGEDHNPETHLIPLVLKTALGLRAAIDIYGTNYSTPDGTCIRDYIHVVDLADAHVKAVRNLADGGPSAVYNLGSETGFSVRQVLERARVVTGIEFPIREKDRRPGDPAVLVAASGKIRQMLGWQPKYSDLDNIIRSAWLWHSRHPEGYGKKD